MSEKTAHIPAHSEVHDPFVEERQRSERKKRTWRLMRNLAIGFILLVLIFIQLRKYQSAGKFPSWSDLFGYKGEAQFPAEVAEWEGPAEVGRFVDELHGMFPDVTDGCCRHHHQYDWTNYAQQECQTNKYSCGKLGIAFPPEYARHPRPPRRHEPFCKCKELKPSSTVYTFSPDEFQRAAVFLDGDFSRGSHVTVDRGTDDDEKDVKVNVTLYVGRDELFDQVSISGFDHEGQYSVQVKRKGYDHHHHCKKPHVKEDCLLYDIHVVFPSHLESFDVFDLHVREASRIGTNTPSELTKLEFNKFRAGLGQGAIHLSNLKAKQIMLATLHGIVMGHYAPTEKFAAVTVKGATKVFVNPSSEKVNSTVVATIGPASAAMPADGFKGNFVVHTWTGSPIVKAPNPNNVHVVKHKYTLKAGYYKEKDTGSNVVVHSKHGDSELIFKGKDDDALL